MPPVLLHRHLTSGSTVHFACDIAGLITGQFVVAEALQHHLEHGLSPREATVKAMKEVSGSVIMIALVLCAVFVPVAFMGGVTGQLISSLLLPSRWLSSSPQSTRSH